MYNGGSQEEIKKSSHTDEYSGVAEKSVYVLPLSKKWRDEKAFYFL